jgi:monofunctional biosynthetic peptidoglycan transglycosylase
MLKKWAFILLSCFFLDTLLVLALYASLPETKSLLKGVELLRTKGNGKTFKFIAGPKNKDYVNLSELPKILSQTVLALEDSRFYQHNGFDHHEIQNAVESSIKHGKRLRGASTISQQLVKNMYLTPERSLRRKFLEALITIKLELTVPKHRILELYLNSIDWGRGNLGIKDAARYYFKSSPQRLNLLQSVYLASIIPNPARFGQDIKDETILDEYARKRMMNALEILYRSDKISMQQYENVLWEVMQD